jgi:2-polyprenyl-3-methyl-5-hydroxy-6-metoxy-1,4-benzoquinol methylase
MVHLPSRVRSRSQRVLAAGARRYISDNRPVTLNRFQRLFCEFNAERLGITIEEATDRFERSSNAVRGGHGGVAYRLLMETTHVLYQPFATDSPSEVWEAYRVHQEAHLLRYLSYREPVWSPGDPIFASLNADNPVIVDFGCGLAQFSITLAEALRARHPRLVLADIPARHFGFLAWLVERLDLDATLRPCTQEQPMPPLEAADVVVAREFFEHVYDPSRYLDYFADYLKPRGWLVAKLDDHRREFGHVSPNLEGAREHAAALGFTRHDKELWRRD